MNDLSSLLRLRDPDRASLTLSPEQDAELFVDIDGLTAVVRSWLKEQAPKGVVYGDYGTGKSHLLRFIEKKLVPERPLRPVYVELAGFGRKATFFDVHLRVMNALLPVLESLSSRAELDDWMGSDTAGRLSTADVRHAVKRLGDSSAPPPERALTRAWLLGTGPTPTQARKAGFTGRLFESASAVDLGHLWQLCSELHQLAYKKRLLLLVDEGEGLQKIVHPDSLIMLYAGIRHLVDPDNQSVGCIFALNTPEAREHPFSRSDVLSRVTGKSQPLVPLNTPERVARFTTELWKKVSTEPRLLTADAMGELSRRLTAMRNAIAFEARPSAVTPTQRDLLSVLSFLTRQAANDQRPPPYSVEDLTRWFPGAFAKP